VKKLLVLLILVVLALTGIVYAVNHPFWEHGTPQGEGAKLEASFPVLYDHLLETVTGSGTVQPQESLVVSTDQAGRVVNLAHDVNDIVQEGDELLQLDDRVQQQTLKQAEAAAASAKAQIEAAKAGIEEAESKHRAAKNALDWVQGLLDKGGGVSEKELIARKADVEYALAAIRASKAVTKAAEAKLDEAREAVAKAKLGVELTHVYVPIVQRPAASGSSRQTKELGQILPNKQSDRATRRYTILERKVSLNQLVGPPISGQLFALTPNAKELQLNAQIAESDIHRVVRGMKAYFTVSAYESHYFLCTVSEIRPLPVQVTGSTYYTALLTVDDLPRPDDRWRLQPGMTAATLDVVTRTIPGDPKAGVWMVPDAAINFPLDKEFWDSEVKEAPSASGDQKWIWIRDPNGRTARPLLLETGASGKVMDADKTGLRSETYTEVKKWLSPTPGLEAGKPVPFEVITGAQPGKKTGGLFKLQVPSLIKS
jgi:multidrug efflux pump subunit AcrA (membrane-fusion protein)